MNDTPDSKLPTDAPLSGDQEASQQALAESDAALARVTEDLIDVLITRGVIQFTDLPPAAQEKLLLRKQNRALLGNRLDLIGDEDPEGLI